MFNSARLAELEGQLSTATETIATLTTERDAATASVSTLTTELATATATIGTLTTERDEAVSSLATMTTARDAAVQEAADAKAGVQKEVRKEIASAGVPAIERVDSSAQGASGETGAGRTRTTWAAKF